MYRLSFICLATIAALPSATLRADAIVLKQGGRIEGELLNAADDAKPAFYLLKTDEGGTIKISSSQVDKVERKSEAEKLYDEYLTRMPDTVEGHWLMAEWCRKNNLPRKRSVHLEEIVRRSPDHEEARYGLGYSRLEDGRWIKSDQWMISQGYIRHKGRWMLRQEILLDEAAEAHELASKKWRRDLKIWRGWIGNRKQQEAMTNFREIEDPLAAMGLSELLKEESVRSLKMLYVEILGKLNCPLAWEAMIQAAIEDEDDGVREACLRELQHNGNAPAVRVFIRGLDPKQQVDNIKINRAAIGLSWMKDQNAVPPLIEALVTEHKTKVGGNSGGGSPIGAGFGNGGRGGLSVGNKPKIVISHVPNEGVRASLNSLTGVDFGFVKEDWRRWYIQTHTEENVDLRRGD